jgi:hypothetical protein
MIISDDNKLLFTLGDAFDFDAPQDLNSILGKLHRFNLDGSIPNDNPISGSSIYSFGHRNCQGLAYGPNGILYSSEHGDQRFDELNIIEANRNYGWPEVEGRCNTVLENIFCSQNNVMQPIKEWKFCIAVNDIVFYNHEAIPEWKGKMLMAALGGFIKDPSISVLSFNETGRLVTKTDEYFKDYGRLRDICINPHSGSIYFATNGTFYPSQGPNRIIEYFNPDFETSMTGPISASDQFVKISPNPVLRSENITIEISDSFIGTKPELFSMTGTKILSLDINDNIIILETQNLQVGSYFIKATSSKGTITKKIIVN